MKLNLASDIGGFCALNFVAMFWRQDLNDLSKSTKTKLGRQLRRPKLKTNTKSIIFQDYFFTFVSASFQRHLAGTPNAQPFLHQVSLKNLPTFEPNFAFGARNLVSTHILNCKVGTPSKKL